MKDKLTIYMKSYISDEYRVLNEYSLSKINNINNWREIKINIPNLISSNIHVISKKTNLVSSFNYYLYFSLKSDLKGLLEPRMARLW